MDPRVDQYLTDAKKWREELSRLRLILQEFGLKEELKWGHPCYSLGDKNVALIHGFKEYFAVLFFKGALLKDTQGALTQQTANVQAGRQMRFSSLHDIEVSQDRLREFVREAIEIEKSGRKVELKKTAEYSLPLAFQKRLEADPALRAAFEGLTPGRQRAYILYFSQPKQEKTREARIEKFLPAILAGKGMDD